MLGRMWGTVSSVQLITELSTPFVNTRFLLYFHKKTSSSLYLYNGLMMTLTFFVSRIVFQAITDFWMVPLTFRIADFSMDPQPLIYYSYFVMSQVYTLYILNWFWFKKMVAGALKHINKSKTKPTPPANKLE